MAKSLRSRVKKAHRSAKRTREDSDTAPAEEATKDNRPEFADDLKDFEKEEKEESMEEDAKKVSTSGRDLGRHRKRQQAKRGAGFNGRKGGNRESVALAGWVQTPRRASNKLSFVPLKDFTGTTQLVVRSSSALEGLDKLPSQSVVLIEGQVNKRSDKQINKSLDTGEIEVDVKSYTLLNQATNLPFNPHDESIKEDLRLQYRYLDLRRKFLTDNLRKRSAVTHTIRNHLHDRHFTEVETPILLKSTPEGAREFLVPTRNHVKAPTFYALPQSPQQPKQLLIASGATDAYFQIAKCFRDEDGRKDRQPEFTQLDIELGFVSGAASQDAATSGWNMGGEQVRNLIEGLIRQLWREYQSTELESTFRVMKYKDAMNKYGSDKPDLRFGLEIALASMSADGNSQTRGLVYRPSRDGRLDGDFLKNHPGCSQITEEQKRNLDVQEGDIVWLEELPTNPEGGGTGLGALRLKLGEQLGLLSNPDAYAFVWIVEFPLFTRADEDKEFLSKGRWSSTHHPFTAPYAEDISLLEENVSLVRGQHYDLVLNGVELGGGSVRIHDASLQLKVFKDVLELTDDEVDRFDHLLVALKSGAPPHAGIALGLDRLVAIMCNTSSIRDVIAFPKSLNGMDRLFKSPSGTTDDILKEYNLEAKKVGTE
ncbi:aspartyl-tRNA synthetase [Wallemia mellicola]|nr:aspartyl-tRNA synthetase [Wallemia mellicola]TIC00306.1 aspartyl-tRNA synthetase [Wallemia mellicola]